jgi:transcriptional regulator GlxA family with amidase domain
MRHVSILLLYNTNIGGLENARQGFDKANEYLINKGKGPVFRIDIVGHTKEVHLDNGMYTVYAGKVIDEIKKTDIIIIPPLRGDIPQAMEKNSPFLPWIVRRHKEGAEVASLCVGAFLLGHTGLLNDKNCVTHWHAAHSLRTLFPNINVVTDKILTDENGIYTSGGAFSAANLVLYIIEKYAGREVAIYCGKFFQIDIDRSSQTPFVIFSGQKDHGDTTIKQAQEYIETHFSDKIKVDQLCDMLGVGRRSFERRFKKATSNTVVEYMQRVKTEAAKKQLESGQKTVNEVMYEVGYSDIKAFRDVFRGYTGMTPVEYRKRYEVKWMRAEG